MATITGSTTSFSSRCWASVSATASMMAAVESIPHLAASVPKSSRTERSCSATKGGGRFSTAWTPREFCAVTAVITDMPYTRNAENVLRSAWIPAPPPESEPAMVSALGINMAP